MACEDLHHTITLSNDGTIYSFGRNFFGRNEDGELGLGHNNDVLLPTPIPNLPQIKMISCGSFFTVCVDHEGFIWSFGEPERIEQDTKHTTHQNNIICVCKLLYD